MQICYNTIGNMHRCRSQKDYNTEGPSEIKLNQNEDDEILITGYERSLGMTLLCWFFIILSGGVLRLILHWWRHWLLLATHRKCSLARADRVLLTEIYKDNHKKFHVKDVVKINRNALLSNAERITVQQTRTSTTIQRLKSKFQRKKIDNFIDIDDRLLVRTLWATFETPPPFFMEYDNGNGFIQTDSIRMFRCKQLRYIWRSELNIFHKLTAFDHSHALQLHQSSPLTHNMALQRRLVYGANRITIPMNSILQLLGLEALNPFYIFQLFSVCLWIAYDYFYYATVIVIMSAFGIAMSIIQTRKNQLALYRTVSAQEATRVLRGVAGLPELIDARLIVPGDILEIPAHGCVMQCDAVLLNGNCIIDESMLTGESVPITKTPLPLKRSLQFDRTLHARHILFAGTKIIQTRYIGTESVRAICIATGNQTQRGDLVRSILYPPPVDYQFEKDSYKFIGLLAFIAFCGFIYSVWIKVIRGNSITKIAVESLDLITIAVPPALPAAMAVGRYYAQKRLERSNIYCISPRTINVAGSVDCVCFDKTGTLTEDGLDMWGVLPCVPSDDNMSVKFLPAVKQLDLLPFNHLLFGMATCHTITRMNGELKGDPLDLKMFESTGWQLEEANISDDTKYDLLFPTIVRPSLLHSRSTLNVLDENGENSFQISKYEIGIVRDFPFTSSLQRQSVITRRLADKHFNLYCKGAPEMIQQLCDPKSIPSDFYQRLNIFAQEGYRIIALASRELSAKLSYAKLQRIERDKIECELNFTGFVVLENRLKPDTTEVIENVQRAGIRCVMITGDNILTALSVAKDCGIIMASKQVIIVNCRRANNDSNGIELSFNRAAESGECSGDTVTPVHDITPSFNYFCCAASSKLAAVPQTDSQNAILDMSNINTDCGKDIDYCFAMVGKTWQQIRDCCSTELLRRFVTRGVVFARMSPDQKQQLITELQAVGYYVAMCGDGANDCGALKAAHAGISLSEAESSVASPFTSRKATISCVPEIIKEGRAALVTSVGIFKFMATYSIVQFSSVLILYYVGTNLTDVQFLFIDLILISLFAFFFGKTEAYSGSLVAQKPLITLIALAPIFSLAIQILLAIGFQLVAWQLTRLQPWFIPLNITEANSSGSHAIPCVETNVIFSITSFQYIILALIFSKGPPYRRPIYANRGLVLALIFTTVISIWLTIAPPAFLVIFFEFVVPPNVNFRWLLIALAVLNCILGDFFERVFVEWLFIERQKRSINTLYHSVNNELEDEWSKGVWPIVTPVSTEQSEKNYNAVEFGPIGTMLMVEEQKHNVAPPEDLAAFFDEGSEVIER